MPSTTSISHPSQLPNYCSHTSSNAFMAYNATQSSPGKVFAKKSYPSMLSHGQNITSSTAQFIRSKKKANFGGLSFSLQQQPLTVSRRNERERNRVKMVNLGFATLRNHIPNGAKNKKMSKVETLKSAVDYIGQLQALLSQVEGSAYSNQINEMMDKSADNYNQNAAAQSLTSSHYDHNVHNQQENSYPQDSSVSPKSVKSSAGSDLSYDSYEAVERQFAEEADLFDFTSLLG